LDGSVAWIIGAIVVVAYYAVWGRLKLILAWISSNWPLFVIWTFLILVIARVILTGLGIPDLFRDDPQLYEEYRVQAVRNSPAYNGHMAATVLVVAIWTVVYLQNRESALDPPQSWRELATFWAGAVPPFLLIQLLAAAFPVLGRHEPRPSIVGSTGLEALKAIGGIVSGCLVVAVCLLFAVWISRGALLALPAPWAAIVRVPSTFLILIVASAVVIPIVWPVIVPSLALCTLFVWIVALHAVFLALGRPYKLPFFALLVVLMVLYNRGPFKYRFPGLVDEKGRSFYDLPDGERPRLPTPTASEVPTPTASEVRAARQYVGLPAIETLEAWRRHVERATGRARPKLVAVAVSGGAYRSGFWTVIVLDELEALSRPGRPLEGFTQHIRLMTGASGGMVGAAYFAALRCHGCDLRLMSSVNSVSGIPTEGKNLIIVAAVDNVLHFRIFDGDGKKVVDTDEKRLTEQARQIAALKNQLKSLWPPHEPTRSEKVQVIDEVTSIVRGVEATIIADTVSNPIVRHPDGKFATYFPRHRDSLTPVVQQLLQRDIPLAFWPSHYQQDDRGVILERQWTALEPTFRELRDGEEAGWRPSLILSPTVVESGQTMLISNLDLREMTAASRNAAVEFFQIFPGASDHLRLQTAVRMSATFPYISPAVYLPMESPARLVDAGYYDNYGVNLSVTWLSQPAVVDWIKRNTSGVILVQIRAYVMAPEGGPQQHRDESDLARALARSTQWLTSPLEGALAARGASMIFRNDAQIEEFKGRFDDGFVQTVIFENPAQFAMNWFIPREAINDMKGKLYSDMQAINELIASWRRD